MMDVKYHIISYFGRVPDLKWEGNILIYIFYLILAPREIFFLQAITFILMYFVLLQILRMQILASRKCIVTTYFLFWTL